MDVQAHLKHTLHQPLGAVSKPNQKQEDPTFYAAIGVQADTLFSALPPTANTAALPDLANKPVLLCATTPTAITTTALGPTETATIQHTTGLATTTDKATLVHTHGVLR